MKWRVEKSGGADEGRQPLNPAMPRRAVCQAKHSFSYLSAYARQPARGPPMLAHCVATMLAYVGVCWPILRATWAHLVAMLAYVCLMLAHVEPKDPKNGSSKKNAVKRRIFWWSAAYLGAMLAHLGAMLAHFGAMLGHLEAYVGPSWGLSWPMLTHLKPQDPKNGKKCEERKTP